MDGLLRTLTVAFAVVGLAGLGCASKAKSDSPVTAEGTRPAGASVEMKPNASGIVPIDPAQLTEPIELKLKADVNEVEKVAYFHRSTSKAFEDNQVRHQKEETMEFVAQAETLKVDTNSDKFTQVITVSKKDGSGSLHDFAMPEPGERLEVTTDSKGKILKSGDYPSNSLFYVSPISLPKQPVVIGDTWTMQASWLSLGEMVPYQLDMVSILKGVWTCGTDRCAEIEISGEVTLQGPISQSMNFKSNWRGRIFFAITAGTVVWSRVESDERLVSETVRRDVTSCLEAALIEPSTVKLPNIAKPSCTPLVVNSESAQSAQ